MWFFGGAPIAKELFSFTLENGWVTETPRATPFLDRVIISYNGM